MLRRLVRSLMYHLYRPLLLHYLRKDRRYRHDGLRLLVPQSVFHPAFFGSSKAFAEFLKKQTLTGLSLLEIGCGSGLLSLTAARLGAVVTARDINPAAVAATRENARANGLAVDVDASDMFGNVPQQAFDRVVVNPPFYQGKPTDDASHAWFCGLEFDFFHRFFKDLPNFVHAESQVWMILADTCDMEGIRRAAEMHGCALNTLFEQKRFMETFIVTSCKWQAANTPHL